MLNWPHMFQQTIVKLWLNAVSSGSLQNWLCSNSAALNFRHSYPYTLLDVSCKVPKQFPMNTDGENVFPRKTWKLLHNCVRVSQDRPPSFYDSRAAVAHPCHLSRGCKHLPRSVPLAVCMPGLAAGQHHQNRAVWLLLHVLIKWQDKNCSPGRQRSASYPSDTWTPTALLVYPSHYLMHQASGKPFCKTLPAKQCCPLIMAMQSAELTTVISQLVILNTSSWLRSLVKCSSTYTLRRLLIASAFQQTGMTSAIRLTPVFLQALWNKAVEFNIRDQTKAEKTFAAVLLPWNLLCISPFLEHLFHSAFKHILSSQTSCQVPLRAGYSPLPLPQVKLHISKTPLEVIDWEQSAHSFRPVWSNHLISVSSVWSNETPAS